MSAHLRRDLDILRRGLLDLANDVQEVVHSAVRSLRERDPNLAHAVIGSEKAIAAEEIRLQQECLKVLALHQPVAGDLRLVAAALKAGVDLQCMADLAEEIAERALALAALPPAEPPARLEEMASRATVMMRQAMEAFARGDVRLARQVLRDDDEVNKLNVELIEEVAARMRVQPATVPQGLSLFSVVRHLERIADHATNIAEDTLYLVKGEIARHSPSARDDD
jgi:phosphate transport system protein